MRAEGGPPASGEPWYRDGLRFGCTGCGACCTVEGYVWVNRREVERLAGHLQISLDEFGARYLRQVGRRYSLTEVPVPGSPRQKACVFWDGKCSVYEARPTQCRTFPFWKENLADPEDWDEVARLSPGVNQGRLYPLGDINRLAAGRGETGNATPEIVKDS